MSKEEEVIVARRGGLYDVFQLIEIYMIKDIFCCCWQIWLWAFWTQSNGVQMMQSVCLTVKWTVVFVVNSSAFVIVKV